MGIRKSRSTSFRRVRSGFAVTKNIVKRTSAYVDPLQARENEERAKGKTIDPASFMNRKQRKAWKRLSPAKRRQYIRKAEMEAGKGTGGKGIALKKQYPTSLSGRQSVDPETAGRLAGVHIEKTADDMAAKKNKALLQQELWKRS